METERQGRPRGERVDIGGRSLRAVRAGPTQGEPLVVLESGAFGFSADWANVQAKLAAEGRRSLAYDRAGLGLSDPGPEPRDGAAIAADLDALLAALGEAGPYLYCGHSMAGLHARLFAARHRGALHGVVLVDATTPEVMGDGLAAGFVQQFARLSRFAAWGADNGLLKPLVATGIGDAIGLSGAAKAEKRAAFADAGHNRWAAAEVAAWADTAAEARAAGPYDPALPIAVILAGAEGARAGWKAHLAAPALAARAGFVEHVKGASHATLLSTRFAPAIAAAIERVRAASGA